MNLPPPLIIVLVAALVFHKSVYKIQANTTYYSVIMKINFLHPVFAAKICGNPGTPANGYKKGLLYQFKSKVTFHCNKCYTLVGAAYRVCNADQKWSDETPTCQSK